MTATIKIKKKELIKKTGEDGFNSGSVNHFSGRSLRI